VFEYKVLRKILGPKQDKLNGQFRILLNEELHDFCRLLSIVRTVKCREL
jgi:hypothetical protein